MSRSRTTTNGGVYVTTKKNNHLRSPLSVFGLGRVEGSITDQEDV